MKYLSVFIVCVIAWASAAPGSRITGGTAATRNQFPYQVSVQWGLIGSWQHVCGGSVVSFNRILTAGHCVTDRPTIGALRIRAGLLNLNENVVGVQDVAVASSAVHPNYTGGNSPNDLAILRLAVSLTFSDAIRPIVISTAVGPPTGVAVLTGWGSTSTTQTPIMPNTLQHATVTILPNAACSTALGALGSLLTTTNICTASGPGTVGLAACQGDSGGPLVQNNQLIGVVSWGANRIPCGAAGIPSVYVHTSSFINWINTLL